MRIAIVAEAAVITKIAAMVPRVSAAIQLTVASIYIYFICQPPIVSMPIRILMPTTTDEKAYSQILVMVSKI